MRPKALASERQRGPGVHEYTWQDRVDTRYKGGAVA